MSDETIPPIASPKTQASLSLNSNATACRISFEWMGKKKRLTPDQQAEVDQNFGAEKGTTSSSKTLFNDKDPTWKALNSWKSRVRAYWVGATLPYPEDGYRLLKKSDVDAFNAKMNEFLGELKDKLVPAFNARWPYLKDEAANKKGALYNEAEYPASVTDLFNFTWDYPSIDPPEWMKELQPQEYAKQKAVLAARIEEAVQLAEKEFAAELVKLTSHLAERLTDGVDGKKILHTSTVTNFTEFLDRVDKLNLHSNEDLDKAIEQLRATMKGVNVGELKQDATARASVKDAMLAIQTAVEKTGIVTAPKRVIVTRKKKEVVEADAASVVAVSPETPALEDPPGFDPDALLSDGVFDEMVAQSPAMATATTDLF